MPTSAYRIATLTAAAFIAAACARDPADGAPGATQVSTDPLFTNGGFEDGTTGGWTITVNRTPASTGSPSGINYPPTSIADLNLRSQGTATNRTYVRSAPTQQIYGLSGLSSPVVPKFGSHSVVVNEGGANYNVNTLRQSYTVTSADVDPADGKVHVRFALAPALQDPGHPVAQQPYFWAQVRNVTRDQVLFYTFNYSNQPGIPWSVQGSGQSQVRYTDWQVFDLAPGNAKLVPGEDVEVTVIAAGCAQSGHWGEVAVDGFGAFLPSISVAGSAPQSANAGAQLTYTFLVKNGTAGVVPNVVVDEVLPAAFSGGTQTGQTTFVSINAPGATCSTPAVGSSGTVSCQLGWMNPSASYTFTVTVAIPAGATGRVANGNYSVRADSVSPLLGPLVETAITSGVTYADLGITVNDTTSAVLWGAPVSYTLDVSNAGPATVTDARVEDAFPAQLTGVSWTCTASGGGSCASASGAGDISSRLVTLPAGAHATFAITGSVVAGSGTGTVTHTASVAAPAGVTDPDDRNNVDADVNRIGTLHPLTVQKAAGATGQGTVTSSPEGIDCGTACASATASFLGGDGITLTAVARPGDTFAGWSGACTGASTTCTVTLSGAATVAATFDGPTVTASVVGGNGALTCPTPVAQGTTSTCTITPAAGHALATLTDDGTDVLGAVSGGTYAVTNVTAPRTIVATFKLARGVACGAAGDCASGRCVDGVCCDVACDGQCQACDVGGSVGTCTPVAGAPHGARAACATDGSACGGSCDGVVTGSCSYPGASTSCRGASCAAGVATAAAACDGAGACPAAQTQACAPYACGPTACHTTCGGDTDCDAASWCSSGSCVPKGGPGATCGAPGQCGSGQCVDGVCCDSACAGQCEACDVAGSVGTCSPVAGAPRGGRASCASDGSACGGTCNGVVTSSCSYPGLATTCRTASCAAGVATLAAGCDGAGACPAAQTVDCAPFTCGATACRGDCAVDADCSAGHWCGGGVCLVKKGPGETCGGDGQCGSGFCVDGVCCDQACGGQCEACDAAGRVGTCTAVTGAPHGSRSACETDGSSCGGACNGTHTGACAYPTSECRAGSCDAGVATVAALCDGAGHCPAVQTVSCSPYVCGPAACSGNCTVDAECASGNWCAAGVCTPHKAQGESCGGPNECDSGSCVDGVCCDTACAGQCEACDVAGSVGQCRPVSGAPRGARPACANDGSACGGVCDGTQGGACTYPAAETSCRSGSCAAGVAALAATCDGAGSCPAEQTVSCSPYACGATTCLGDCTGDGDCAGDHYCAAGVCTLRKGAGEPCGTPGQCQSGSCVDGVCCDSACTGQCEACDVAGSLGTCSAVTGAPHGARTACTSDGSACAGACDGASRDACAYPGGTTTCRAPSCADGVAVVAAACGGTGACPALLEESCAPYACGADACLTSCGGDADCAGGFTCSAGQCVTAGTGGAGLSVEGSGCGSGGSAGGPLLLLWLVALMPRLRRRGGGAALAGLGLTLLAAPLSAHAQAGNAPSFEVERFRPEGGARDVMGVPSASVPAHLEKHLSAWLSYADQPLRLTGTGSTPYDATLVRSQTTLQLGASIGLLDRYELAAMVPLTSASGDRPPGLSGVSLPDPGAALGDLGLSARAHLADLGPVGLAVAVPLRLPTGARSAYSGHGGVTGGLEALAEWRAPGELRALFSAGWVQRGERHLVDLTVGSALTFGLAAEVPLPVKLAGSPVVALSTLSGELGVGHGATASPMELLLAARARLPLGLEMTLGAGPGIGKGYGTPRFRALASLAFAPRSPPPPPVAAPEPPAPAPEPAVVAAAEPPPQPAADPLPPEPSAVVAEAPPAEAAPAPVPEPEAAPPQVVVTRERLVILQQVHFANDRDVILPDSFTLLDEVARVLVANPQIARVRVEGHTDSKGKPAYNTRLSKRRAAMVRGFLVKRGVEEGRLLAHGFGPERPIASNDTEEGRSRNRRVEFVILEER